MSKINPNINNIENNIQDLDKNIQNNNNNNIKKSGMNGEYENEKLKKKESEKDIGEIVDLNSNNDTDKLSESLQKLLLENKEFAEPVVRKKENKLFTNYCYSTFKNSYAENTCYINVILHLLYTIQELKEFLKSLYEIDLSTKKNNKNKNVYNNNDFLVSIGKILKKYEDNIGNDENEDKNLILNYFKLNNNNNKNKNVTVINTLEMRKILEQISENKFPLNTIADPVELFTFILDILKENLNEDTHKSFYLELIDEYTCTKRGCNEIKNKYDKDNFMYHIYIDEILKYIEKQNIKVKDYKNKLFQFSYKLFLSENKKICDKCKGEMNHSLICQNSPDFILINCVWRQSNPIVDDVMTIFFLMSLKDELNNLFVCKSRTNKNYYLLGFILYSFTLSHYIICEYNIDEDVFILLDDEIVKEYHNLNELITDITAGVLRQNGKAFFYPVMMIYTKDILFKNNIIKLNTLNEIEYQNIINKCNEAIYEYESQNEIKEEMKLDNYQELIKQQQEIENEIKKKVKFKTEIKNNKKDKTINQINSNKTDIKKKINFEEKKEEYQNKINNETEEEKNNNIKKGLEKINQNKIINILRDIKDKGRSIPNDLYLGELIRPHHKSKSKSKKKQKKEEIEDEIDKNKFNKYQSVIDNRYEIDKSKEIHEKKSRVNSNILKETNNLIQQNNLEDNASEAKKSIRSIRRNYINRSIDTVLWKNNKEENYNNKIYKSNANEISSNAGTTIIPNKKRFHRKPEDSSLLGKKIYNNNESNNRGNKIKQSKSKEKLKNETEINRNNNAGAYYLRKK